MATMSWFDQTKRYGYDYNNNCSVVHYQKFIPDYESSVIDFSTDISHEHDARKLDSDDDPRRLRDKADYEAI